MTKPSERPTECAAPFRAEIQALRGYAVLLVLLGHAGFPWAPAGFLGVDIFFVISGFLTTRLILEGLDSGHFSVIGFYARRARRLLPAAYATLIATALAAFFLIDRYEFTQFVAQLAGGFGFSANFVLWRQSDYFGIAAAQKPLLHLWSLSLEAQFYLGLPLVLLLLPRRGRFPVMLGLSAVSLALCLLIAPLHPAASFYLLPTRTWELGLGALTALMAPTRRHLPPWSRAGARLLLLLLPIFTSEAGHPGWAALAICLATARLLLSEDGRPATPAPLVALGNRSYSLYLVHWPLFAFAQAIYIAKPPAWLAPILVVLALLLAELQFRLVEAPLRRAAWSKASYGWLVAIPFATLLIALAAILRFPPDSIASRAGNTGLGGPCAANREFRPLPECRSHEAPDLLIWGDSFAMHLVDGALASGARIEQATRSFCGPFLGLAPIRGAQYSAAWAENCIRFNEAVLAHIAATPTLRVIVLASALAQYLPGAESEQPEALIVTNDGRRRTSLDENRAAMALTDLAASLHALGRKVVLIAPPPANGEDSARCLARRAEGLPFIAQNPDCTIALHPATPARAATERFLALIEARAIAPIYRFEPALCRDNLCAVQQGGVALFRDASHFSRAGSRLLGEKWAWNAAWHAAAR